MNCSKLFNSVSLWANVMTTMTLSWFPFCSGVRLAQLFSSVTWQQKQSWWMYALLTGILPSSFLQFMLVPKALLHNLWPDPLPKSQSERACVILPSSLTGKKYSGPNRAYSKYSAPALSCIFCLCHQLLGAPNFSKSEGDTIQALYLLRF